MTARKRAFTLIELLIVVAIIAILAAIAVPNFLEAQVRSKIARAKADMRSLGTGIEEYAVDYNVPPPDLRVLAFFDGVTFGSLSDEEKAVYQIKSLFSLTTPISYMTSIPRDPFRDKAGVIRAGGNVIDRPYYNYFTPYFASLGVGIGGKADVAAKSLGYTWILYSVGPGRDQTMSVQRVLGGIWDKAVPYDATNGTTTRGYIIRTNKGEFVGEEVPK